eukprot:4766310-Amphidinium_carterae.1
MSPLLAEEAGGAADDALARDVDVPATFFFAGILLATASSRGRRCGAACTLGLAPHGPIELAAPAPAQTLSEAPPSFKMLLKIWVARMP